MPNWTRLREAGKVDGREGGKEGWMVRKGDKMVT